MVSAPRQLTHGRANGAERWPDEIDTLDRLGRENLDAIEETLDALRHRLRLRAAGRHHRRHGAPPGRVAARCGRITRRRFLDRTRCAREVDSPTFLAGVREPHDTALVDPAKLAWGLAAAAESLGVRIHEHTPVVGDLRQRGRRRRRDRRRPVVRARKVVLGTNAFPSLVRRLRLSHRARLRLRPDDRAAEAEQLAAGRLGRTARASTTWPTSSTTSG